MRASGSGAGCGSHWPLCNGEVVPRGARLATLIEFGHRVTSALALIAVIALALVVFRMSRRGESARALDPSLRKLAWLSMLFMFGEAAIGAGIVLLELVGGNASLARAGWMAGHLINTFLLLGALALLADRADADSGARPRKPHGRAAFAGLAALLATGASGAIAALGDTLFPATSLAAGVAHDLALGASFLVRLRAFHPLIAVGAALFWLHLAQEARRTARSGEVREAAKVVTALVLAQLAVGLVNFALLAPVALQLAHLLLADLVWIAGVLLLDRSRRTADATG